MRNFVKYAPIILGSILIFLFVNKPIFAAYTAYSSASLNHNNKCLLSYDNNLKLYKNNLVVKNLLERYRSPLVNVSDNFINACIKYQLDCYLLPAIAGLESSFGKYIYPNSYNPFGWDGGYYMFTDWQKSIDIVASGLRHQYYDKGAITIEDIGAIYSQSPTWASRIKDIMNEFIKEEQKTELYFRENSVEL